MTMIERVARALVDSFNKTDKWVGKSACPWEELPRQAQEFAFEQARAAIAAMRQPTTFMVKAGTINWDSMDGTPIKPMFDPTTPYQAMIDKALKE